MGRASIYIHCIYSYLVIFVILLPILIWLLIILIQAALALAFRLIACNAWLAMLPLGCVP